MLIVALPPTYTSSSQIDHVRAHWCGNAYSAKSANSALCAIARVLIDAGCPDQQWRLERNGQLVLEGPSLARIAKLSFSETDRGMRYTKWQPFTARTVAEEAA